MSKVLNVINALVSGGRDLTCESCGKDFVCGMSLKGCWCAEMKLDDETRSDLRSKYKECLCQECLENLTRFEVK
jgi:hypothetical protein